MKNLLLALLFFGATFLNGAAQNSVEKETLVYTVHEGKELLMDKYVDNSVPFDGNRPVFIYVHGGGFATGSRVNALQIQYLKHFTARGFVAIGIDYRLGIQGGVQADQKTVMNAVSMATSDLIEATAFILDHAEDWGIDPGKIIISGGSAGAITCLNAAYDISSERKLSARLPLDFNYAGVISHAGAVIVSQDTLTWKTAPAPMLLMHGNKDMQVPFESFSLEGNLYAGSNYLSKQFSAANAPHWLYEEDGADHIVALKPLQYNFEEIDAFIDRFVMGGQKSSVHTTWKDSTPGSMEKMMEIVPLYIIGWGKTDEEAANQK